MQRGRSLKHKKERGQARLPDPRDSLSDLLDTILKGFQPDLPELMTLLQAVCCHRMLVTFYVLRIVLIDVATGRATPGIDGYDLRLAFARIVKERAPRMAVLTSDN